MRTRGTGRGLQDWSGMWAAAASLALAAGAMAQTESGSATQPEPAKAAPMAPEFDANSDAVSEISKARETAQRDSRQVLVVWGDDALRYCKDMTAMLRTDEQIRRVLESEYVVVKVGIGRFEDKNFELGKRYNSDYMTLGVPILTVIDPVTDSTLSVLAGRDVLVKPPIAPRIFDADKVRSFLESNKARPQVATQLLAEAQGKATARGQRVLAWFTGPDCRGCAAWERAVSSPEIEKTLSKAFVLRRIQTARTVGGDALESRLRSGEKVTGGWLTALDGNGKPVAEAGAGVNLESGFDATAAAAWLVKASNGKLDASDQAALAAAMEKTGRKSDQEKN